MRRLATALTAMFAVVALVRSQEVPASRPPVIVIDAGHGGEDVGVRGASGLEEKQLALEVAQSLQARIETTLGLQVLLTRGDDRVITADERAAAANGGGGALFISLHANAAPVATVSGAEVYYQALDAPGPPPAGRDLFLIPWEEAQARHHEASARAAAIVHEELQQIVPMSPHPPRPLSTRPLVGVSMPAVLVEMLYLTNPEQDMAVADLKEQVATALAAAIDRFRVAASMTPE